MENVKDNYNVAFEIYSMDGKMIDKITEEYYKVLRIQLDGDGKELPSKKDELLMLTGLSPEEIEELANNYGCDHFYASGKDDEGNRYMNLVDMENGIQIVYYYEPD